MKQLGLTWTSITAIVIRPFRTTPTWTIGTIRLNDAANVLFLNFASLIFALVGQLTDKHEKISEFFGGLFLGGIFVCYSWRLLDALESNILTFHPFLLRQSKVVKLSFKWSLNSNFQCNKQTPYVQLVKLSNIIVYHLVQQCNTILRTQAVPKMLRQRATARNVSFSKISNGGFSKSIL